MILRQEQMKNNAKPKRETGRNPMRLFVCLAIVSIFFDLVEMGFFRGELLILAPFSTLFMGVYLSLAVIRSKYAWHILVFNIIVYTPAFLILRPRDYFANNTSGIIVTLIVYIAFLLYTWKVYKPYKEYVSLYKMHKNNIYVFPLNLMSNEQIRENMSVAFRKITLSLKLFILSTSLFAIAILIALFRSRFCGEETTHILKTIFYIGAIMALIGGGLTIWFFVSALFAFLGYGTKNVEHSSSANQDSSLIIE